MGFFKETGINANLFKGNTFVLRTQATYQSPHFANTASELKGDCSLYHRGIAVWIPEFFFYRLYKIFLSGLPPLPSQENTAVGYVCVSGFRALRLLAAREPSPRMAAVFPCLHPSLLLAARCLLFQRAASSSAASLNTDTSLGVG